MINYLTRGFPIAFALTIPALQSSSAANINDSLQSCLRQSDLNQRVQACTSVIDNSRDRRILIKAFNTRGLALCDLDRCAEAISDFDEVIAINPSIAGYYDNRARALRAAKRFDDAIADSERAIRMAPTYSFTFLGKAYTLDEAGRQADALTVIGQALAIDPNNAGAWEFRGKVLGELQRYGEAYASYDRSFAIQPDRPSVYKTRAETESNQGNVEGALADYARYPGANDDTDVVGRVAALRLIKTQTAAQAAANERIVAAEREAKQEHDRADAEKARADAASTRVSSTSVTLQNPAATMSAEAPMSREDAERLAKSVGEIGAQINALKGALEEQRRLKSASDGDVATVDLTINLVEAQIVARQAEYVQADARLSKYLSNVRPEDRDTYTSARTASQAFPRVPYYIPGTKETGEFWIEPEISPTGALNYEFRFVDPASDYNQVRETIDMTPSELGDTQAALTKVRAWSQKAHDAGVRKVYSKRAACFPQADCPVEGSTLEGKSSTEILFNVYEDGSTSGRIQRNKGRYVEGYNVSSESALLLSAYIAYARKVADKEFSQGTQTKQDLDKLFR